MIRNQPFNEKLSYCSSWLKIVFLSENSLRLSVRSLLNIKDVIHRSMRANIFSAAKTRFSSPIKRCENDILLTYFLTIHFNPPNFPATFLPTFICVTVDSLMQNSDLIENCILCEISHSLVAISIILHLLQ